MEKKKLLDLSENGKKSLSSDGALCTFYPSWKILHNIEVNERKEDCAGYNHEPLNGGSMVRVDKTGHESGGKNGSRGKDIGGDADEDVNADTDV